MGKSCAASPPSAPPTVSLVHGKEAGGKSHLSRRKNRRRSGEKYPRSGCNPIANWEAGRFGVGNKGGERLCYSPRGGKKKSGVGVVLKKRDPQ